MNFDFNQNYILEDNIVLLRPLEANDYNNLLEYALNEPELWSFNEGGAAGAEGLKKYIDTTLTQRQAQKEYPFIVFDKRANKYIGSTRFYDMQFPRKTIQLGYTWYGKQYQGTGINKNCKYLLFDFAFTQLNMERIGMGANNNNKRSIKAMQNIGCTLEGVLRNYTIDAQGNRNDAAVLSMLKTEWQNQWQQKLKAMCLT